MRVAAFRRASRNRNTAPATSSQSSRSFFDGSSDGNLGNDATLDTLEVLKESVMAENIFVESERARVSGPVEHWCYQMKLRRLETAGWGGEELTR